MYIAILQFELLIRGASSIKDKRNVVRSVKDRLHREQLVSVAEVAHLDNMAVAGMAIAAVNRDGRYLQGMLDSIERKLRSLPDAELGECYREVLSGDALPAAMTGDDGQPLWDERDRREEEHG